MTPEQFEVTMRRLVNLWPATKITEGQIAEYFEFIACLPFDDINGAVAMLVNEGHRWRPSVPDLIRASGHATESGDELTAELPGLILSAAARYGWQRTSEAREALPSAAWAVVTQLGGWQAVCATPAGTLTWNTSKLAAGAVAVSRREAAALTLPNGRDVLTVEDSTEEEF